MTKKKTQSASLPKSELQKQLKKNSSALKKLKRELKIEASLEQVRARAMTMQKSDELLDTSSLFFQQIKELGETVVQASIAIVNEDAGFVELSSSIHGNHLPLRLNVPIDDPYVMAKGVAAWKAKRKSLALVFKGQELKNYNERRNSFLKTKVSFPEDQWVVNLSFFSKGWLSFSSNKNVTDDTTIMLNRFAAVIEQTYTRFLDLQKAESQAREAQIEAALEKVRSRSLAMHKTDELQEVVSVAFEKLKELSVGLNAAGAIIVTFTEGSKDTVHWLDSPDFSVSVRIDVPYDEHPIHKDLWKSKEGGEDFFAKTYPFEEMYSFHKYLFEHTDYKFIPDEVKNWVFTNESYTQSVAWQSNSAIILYSFNNISPSEKEIEILKRFSKVFEQSYVRFLDLQKAEVQARESQIQLALERARTQSMIMQHSNELDDTLRVFHEQVLLLGIKSAFSFLWLPDEEKDRHIFWAAWAENNSTIFKSKAINYPLDRNEPATKQCLIDWKGNDPVVSYHVPPASVKDYFAAWSELIADVEELKPENFSDGLYYVEAFMKYGCFGVIVKNTLSEDEKKILGRFAIEFERAYTRFLDLQKAEAQAREAQIEAALEKVRSRSLAMHKSEEIIEVVRSVFDRLSELHVELNTAFIIIFKEGSRDTEWWLINKDKGEYSSILVPYADIALLKEMFAIKEQGKEIFSATYYREEKNELFRYLFTQTDFKYAPAERQKFIFDSESVSIAMGMTNKIAIQITRHHDKSFSEADNEIIRRFTKVFDQSYTRFLDLQKAEAQAREAQIEAALERVRSKAMSMQKSEDLSNAVAIVFDELEKMDLGAIRCGISIINKENHTTKIWSTTKIAEGTAVQVSGDESMDIHPLLKGAFNSWVQLKDFSYVLKDDDLTNFYTALSNTNFKLPYDQAGLSTSEQHMYVAHFPVGGLYVFKESEFSEDVKKIIKRFGEVFNLTYTRFNDLQIAEASAKEAIRQAALDRIRADIASMRTTKDLERITPLIWNELNILNVPFIRCGVFIMDDEQKRAHTFLSTPEGKAIATLHIPFEFDLPIIYNGVEHWRKKKIYKEHWDANEFVRSWTALSSLGETSSDAHQREHIPENLYLHMLPFLQGTLYVGNDAPLNEDELQLVQDLADAFSTAYARYEDFNKLESAKQQIEKTLVDLKQAQSQLIQSEKMASLGELTAGIAHEIQNLLNFVNNFSEVNKELIEESNAERLKPNAERNEQIESEILNDIKSNEEKINHHGKRADAIVKGMLQHSRSSVGVKELTDINAVADEYLRLSYHGLRAKDNSFNATMKTDFDASIGKINIIPQDIGRVLLNLYNNAFYAVAEKSKLPAKDLSGFENLTGLCNFEPTISISTKKTGNNVLITVSDNGNGIPQKVIDKIFQPFFTTKPTGQGTGLGLSLSYDIIKAHGGEIKVETKECEGSEFIIQLPVV